MDKVKEMIDNVKSIIEPMDGLQQFVKKQGFDLDKGDVMVIPKGFAEAHDIHSREGVLFTEHFDCSIFLLRGVNWNRTRNIY